MKRAAHFFGMAIALCLAAACEKQRTVDLTFGDNSSGLNGFACKAADGTLLLQRAQNTNGSAKDISVIVDFVAFSGDPGCRTSQMVAFCTTHSCAAIPAARKCLPLTGAEIDALPGTTGEQKFVSAIATLKGQLLSGSPPDGVTLVRVVGSTETCAQLAELPGGTLPAFDTAQILGAAYSCPVHFDEAPSPLYLGLDTLTSSCEDSVYFASRNVISH